jgi:hypothetical protein
MHQGQKGVQMLLSAKVVEFLTKKKVLLPEQQRFCRAHTHHLLLLVCYSSLDAF